MYNVTVFSMTARALIVFSLYSDNVAPSPLPSPRRSHAGDELTHAKAVLESVCSTNEIGHDAITKLCSHVKADPQEQQVHIH